MTIQEAQQKINDWIMNHGGGYFNELTNLGILTEETGELARWMVRKYGDQTLKDSEKEIDIDHEISDELADVMWVVICLANQMKIDLNEALEKNLHKKTSRDRERHKKK